LAWYHADSITGLADGAAVPAWTDSAFGNNVTQSTTGNQPTYVSQDSNGKPAVRFNGNQWLYNPNYLGNGIQSDMTLVEVGSTASPGSQQYSIFLGNGAARQNRGIMYGGGAEGFDFSNGGVSGGTAPSANIFVSEIASIDSGLDTVNFYQNGVPTVSAPGQSNVGPVGQGIDVGGTTDQYDPWQGDISEILVYDHALSTAEIQQLSVYLAAKYNLALAVPAPTISPNGGSFSSSVSVSFSGQISPEVVRFTLDGSSPTSSSTLYTGAFSLTKSAPVSAAIFLNNVMVSPVATAQFDVGDSGGIGISDAWQTEYFGHTGINPNTVGLNGLTYLQDYLYGYNPLLYSTNGDGLSDQVNHILGIAGNNTDIDGDGLTNAQELLIGTDPFNPDTDGDGWYDGPGNNNQYSGHVDYYPLDPTRWLPPSDNPNDNTPPVINLTNPSGAVLISP
jgi:hypothetical protein